jgi:hypothetical protein
LLLLALALLDPAHAADDAPHVTRVYLGGGSAQSGGTAVGAGEIGFDRMKLGDHFLGSWGGGLMWAQVNPDLAIPLWDLHANVRWAPFGGGFRPYAGAGLGVTVLLILPFPTLQLDLGAMARLSDELWLNGGLSARQIFTYGDNEPVSLATLQLGIAF